MCSRRVETRNDERNKGNGKAFEWPGRTTTKLRDRITVKRVNHLTNSKRGGCWQEPSRRARGNGARDEKNLKGGRIGRVGQKVI